MTVFEYYQTIKSNSTLFPLYRAGVLSDSFVRHGEIYESYLNTIQSGMNNKDAVHSVASFFDVSVPTVYRIRQVFSTELLQD